MTALRQIGSISDLAIDFPNITQIFSPLWPDHPLIFIFPDKLRENIRFEVTARGSISTTFQTYLTASISTEQNQAGAALSRSQPTSQPPSCLPFTPKLLSLSAPAVPEPAPSHPQHVPMDLDATHAPRGPLYLEERRRRYDSGMCAYSG